MASNFFQKKAITPARGQRWPRSDKKPYTGRGGRYPARRGAHYGRRPPIDKALRMRADLALGSNFMRSIGARMPRAEILRRVEAAELKKKIEEKALRRRLNRVVRAPFAGAISARERRVFARRRLYVAPDVTRSVRQRRLKTYSRSRRFARLRSYFKLFPLLDVPRARLAAAYKKIRHGLLRVSAAGDFVANDDFDGAPLVFEGRSAVVVRRPLGKGAGRIFKWSGHGRIDLAGSQRFFYNVFLVRLVASAYSASLFHLSKVILRGATLNTRGALSRAALSVAVPAVLAGILGRRLDSPAASPAHFLWLEAAASRALAGKSVPRFPAFIKASSAFNSLLFSRRLFWAGPDFDESFIWWHYRFYSRLKKLALARQQSLLSRARGAAVGPVARRAAFAGRRDARQAADLIRLNSERRPHWLASFTATVPRTVAFPVWDYAARGTVGRKFVVWIDPAGEVSPLRALNDVPARRHALVASARLFFRALFRVFRKGIERELRSAKSPLTSAAAASAVSAFEGAMLEYLQSSAREYRDFTKDLSLTLRASSAWRYYDSAAGREELALGALASARVRSQEVTPFAKYFRSQWQSYAFNKKMVVMLDRNAKKLAGGKDIIPTRFFITSDLEESNFSTYYSCNRTAFIKLITSAVRGASSRGALGGRAAALSLIASFSAQARDVTAILARFRSLYARRPKLPAARSPRRLGRAAALFLLSDRRWLLRSKYGRDSALLEYTAAAALARRLHARTAALREWRRELAVGELFALLLNYGQAPGLAPLRFSGDRRAMDRLAQDLRRPRRGDNFRELRSYVGRAPAGRAFRSRSTHLVRTFTKHLLTTRLLSYKFPILTAPGELWRRRAPLRVSAELSSLFARATHAASSFMSRRYRLNYHHYLYKYVYVRRAAAALRDSLFEAMPEYKSAGVRGVFGEMGEDRPRLLFKHNPDAVGRSRVFYYVQKKTPYMRKSNKPYRLIKLYLPFMNLSTSRLAAHSANKHLVEQHARRLDVRRRYFKLKIFLRHILRRDNNYTSFGLFARWRAIKETKKKWFTYYRKLEGGLAKYVWLCGLVSGRRAARQYVEAGLFYVNTFVCTNPDYYVRPGDIITMNPEAYRAVRLLQLSRHIKRRLAAPGSQNNAKRRALNMALGYLRWSMSSSVVSAARGPDDRRRAVTALRVLSEKGPGRPREAFPGRAPGGAPVGRAQVYTGGITRFSADSTWGRKDKARLSRALASSVKKFDSSRGTNGAFYYRLGGSLISLRNPASAKEFFSLSRVKKTNLFNPRVFKIFTSHRYWH